MRLPGDCQNSVYATVSSWHDLLGRQCNRANEQALWRWRRRSDVIWTTARSCSPGNGPNSRNSIFLYGSSILCQPIKFVRAACRFCHIAPEQRAKRPRQIRQNPSITKVNCTEVLLCLDSLVQLVLLDGVKRHIDCLLCIKRIAVINYCADHQVISTRREVQWKVLWILIFYSDF